MALLLALATPAVAQTEPAALTVIPGTHVTRLPAETFVAASCRTADGAVRDRLPLADLGACAEEDDGLATIAFRHDDTAEYEALARGNPGLAAREAPNSIAGIPAEFSFRVDAAGRIAAIVATAAASAEAFAALRDAIAAAWTCTGPEMIAPTSSCSVGSEGRRLVLDWPAADASRILLTITALDPANPPAVALGLDQPQPDTRPGPPYSGRLAAFLAGASVICPGCDLADADLRYRNLDGADLTDADLSGAVLHGSSLAGANLAGAKLAGANLNRTMLDAAIFTGADLASATLYGATGTRADFTGAGLSSALLGRAQFDGASFNGASLDGADLTRAILDGASFFFATLRYAALDGSSFAGADLRGTVLSDATAAGASFASANLADAALTRADLRRADFSSATLTNADFVDTMLEGAILGGALMDGADFSGAVPPVAVP